MLKSKDKVLKTVNKTLGTDYKKLKKISLGDTTTFMRKYFLRKEGLRFAYIPEESRFRVYNNGVWEKHDKTHYIEKKIRLILKAFRQNYKKYNIKNVLHDLKYEAGKKTHNIIFSDNEQPKDKINFLNGMLYLKDMELRGHDYKDYSIFQMPIEYNPDAKCPKWEKTLTEWVENPNTIDFLQEYVGYLLVPDNSLHLFPILYGEGANGKSVFLKVIREIMGVNVSYIGLSQFFGNQSRWMPAKLQNKLANICGDISPIYMKKQGIIKSIITQDSITVERKNKEPYSLLPITRFLFSANELPKSRDKSYGWYRRLEIIPFPNRFVPGTEGYNPDLENQLKKELPGIVNWAIEGLIRLKENEEFTKSIDMIQAKNKYIYFNDPITLFINEHYDITTCEEDYIDTDQVYQKYKRWSENNNFKPENKGIMTKLLKRKEVKAKNKTIDGKTSRHYIGIRPIEDTVEFIFGLDQSDKHQNNEYKAG